MNVIHFHNILLGKPACFAAPAHDIALTLVPENVTCPGCRSYLGRDVAVEPSPAGSPRPRET